MSKNKKITAPKTYKPSGKPKEHLAYLNEREMAYLHSLGGSGRPGPKGIPSFADDSASSKGVSRGGNGAVGSSGTTSRSSGPGGPSGPNSGSSGTHTTTSGGNVGGGGSNNSGARNPTGGSLSAPSRTAPSSGVGSGGNSGSRNPTGGALSAPARTAPSINASRDTGFADRSGRNDTAAAQSAQTRSAIDTIKNNPAVKSDLRAGGISTINVGPMGTPVTVGAGPIYKMTPLNAQQSWVDQQLNSIADSISYGYNRMMGYNKMYGPLGTDAYARLPMSGNAPTPKYGGPLGKNAYDRVPQIERRTAGPSDALSQPVNKLGRGSLKIDDMALEQDAIRRMRDQYGPNAAYGPYSLGSPQRNVTPTGNPNIAGNIASPGMPLRGAAGSYDAIKYYNNPPTVRPAMSRPYDDTSAPAARSSTVGTGFGRDYNPLSSFDATRSLQAAEQIARDPSLAGRLAEADRNYRTLSGPGGMISRTYSDPDINTPTFGDRVSQAMAYANDTWNSMFGPTVSQAAVAKPKPIQDRLPQADSIPPGNAFNPNAERILEIENVPPEIARPPKLYTDRIPPTETRPTQAAGTYFASERQNPFYKNASAGLPPGYAAEYGIESERGKTSGLTSADLGGETPVDGTGSYPDGYNPSQEPASPSQDITITQQAQEAEAANNQRVKNAKLGLRGLGLAVPGGSLIAGGFGLLNDATNALVEQYQTASIPERAIMEQKYPNLIRHAEEMGIQTGSGTMADYRAWAERAGLTGSGAGDGGGSNERNTYLPDMAFNPPASGNNNGNTGGSTGSGNGQRPEIYFMWDVGVNIPSPGDANYNLYVQYLKEKGIV